MSAAQPATERGDAPIRCYVHATEQSNLESGKAKRLCIGATGEAPARCLAEATDRLALTDLDAVRLCQAATSLAPAQCAARLEESADVGSTSIISYCAATSWPLVVAPTAGSPACVQAALDRTLLSDRAAVQLCRGSASIAPVLCYEAGEQQTFLSDQDLIDLCTPVVFAQPYQLPS